MVLYCRTPTSDVVAVQQRLEVADLLQKRCLREQEVLLCHHTHTQQHKYTIINESQFRWQCFHPVPKAVVGLCSNKFTTIAKRNVTVKAQYNLPLTTNINMANVDNLCFYY